ncbi:MAG: bifunctional phosphopantothenoylcysteine decarboxylase/phosphopantothenate--cysteine ligase CoaBC [Acidothermales bacterium]|nr:bifunctional phosphopantothenoylcysteine decarboxylase/phosphopantothenate--cysteine ligase CoaBC [Acidothermales bacterium]
MRPRVVVGVGGGIAAYKVCEVVRRLVESGHHVRVVSTASALRFVGAATWAALSGEPVRSSMWDDVHEVAHVRLGRTADLVLVAPATADLLAKAAHGLADDLLTATLLTARCPLVFVPAMHTEMWEHPATRANVETLRARGAVVVEPAVGRLTGADSGPGRLPEPDSITALARRILARGVAGLTADLAGRRVVISAGGTREHLDPVRFLGNRSSGRQGYALAGAAVARGAEVTLVTANVTLADPAGARLVRVTSAAELRDAVLAAAPGADAVVMAAAVADFRPAEPRPAKIKKDPDGGVPPPVALVRTADVLAELTGAGAEPGRVVVGFAAETGGAGRDVLALGREKLARKGVDLLVVNEVGESLGFDSADNAAVVLGADGSETVVPLGPKDVLADVVWDLVAARLPPPGTPR